MEPSREPGDDRVMVKIRPLHEVNGQLQPSGGWAVMENQPGAVGDYVDDADVGQSYEVRREVVTAEEWNEMPEFYGW